MTLDGILLRLRNMYVKFSANFRKKQLVTDKFTIISNNCWGGIVYESYNLKKQTPTAGLFFMAEEYLRFVSNLKYYTQECEISFIASDQARHKKFYSQDPRYGAYPIARVGDVEIAMLHYHSEEEAAKKWKSRCGRIRWNKLIVKMCDQNECTKAHAKEFLQLPLKNKLFFTVHKDWADIPGITVVKSNRVDHCGLFDEPFGIAPSLNMNSYINQLK